MASITCPQKRFLGRINKAGYYKDCVPIYAIFFNRDLWPELIQEDGSKHPIFLEFQGKRYSGAVGISKKRYVKIFPELVDICGCRVRLADLLLEFGLESKNTICIMVSDGVVELSPL